ncbi:MAG: glycosyltransferase family 4 protein [Akkermansiaceae bacterium]|nr:glycosyltransferase family 4 protein [Akkermansiaceae bacterium]
MLTTTCNRAGIESYQTREQPVAAQFVYEQVSSFSARLNRKAKSKVGVLVRLLLWQIRIKKRIRAMVHENDYHILHHLTLGSFRMPFSVTGHGIPSVVGPVGGCEMFPPHLLPEGEPGIRLREIVRNLITSVHEKYGLGLARYKSAGLTLSCTREMQHIFARWGVSSLVFPNIGMHPEQLQSAPGGDRVDARDGGLKLLFVGNLLYWKGLELAAMAMESLPENVTLCCVGVGADRAAFENLLKRRKLDKRVELLGSLARDELLEKYAAYDVFFFPSLHDSGGMVVIEAMRAGLPVICLGAGGPGVSVTEQCGRVVTLGPKLDVVEALQEGVKFYLENPDMLAAHGIAARRRVNEEYSWGRNAHRMIGLYRSLIKDQSLV